MPSSPARPRVPVDGHVHLHPCLDLGRALDAALGHAERVSREHDRVGGDRIVLCVADPEGGARFRSLRGRSARGELRPWELASTDEETSVAARREDGGIVTLVEGRQVRTAERLEVLALATSASLPDGEGFEATVRRALDAEAVVVVPWGFGKWWSRRGERLRRLLDSPLGRRIHLGDNAGRLPCGPHLGLLREGRRRTRPTLPGSDPLPFPDHADRIGQYGFLLPGLDVARRPARCLRSLLAAGGDRLVRYGTLDPPHRALLSQVRLRLPRLR